MTNYLPQGYKLNSPRGEYTIEAVIGRGATAIAYIASFDSGNGLISKRILKECYPSYVNITRVESGDLLCESRHEGKFSDVKRQFEISGATQNDIRNIPGLTNLVSPILDRIHSNNTVYLDVMNFDGETWENKKGLSLLEKIRICLSVAKAVKRIHNAEHLCLDLKPSNILVLDTTSAADDVVHFIDFDSIRKKTNIGFGNSLSFTEMWAAPEQSNPYSYSSISEATDIYTLGELVFWSVFNRHSTAKEHRAFSNYPFQENSEFEEALSRKAIQDLLTNIFRNTLRSATRNRFQKTDSLIELLDMLVIELQKKEYLITSLPEPNQFFVGRDYELSYLDTYLAQNKIVFLYGVSGIGKSEIAKQYIRNHKSEYSNILYWRFSGNIEEMICDETNIKVANVDRLENQSDSSFCRYKLSKIKALLDDKTLIVIDNFDIKEAEIEQKQMWEQLRALPGRLLITTKVEQLDHLLKVGEIESLDALRKIFLHHFAEDQDSNLQCKDTIDRVVEVLDRHTLLIELVAKQAKKAFLSPSAVLDRLTEAGFSTFENEYIGLKKDGQSYNATIQQHIKRVFRMSQMTEEQQATLVKFAMMPLNGIDASVFKKFYSLESFNSINWLVENGWLYRNTDSNILTIHPIIAKITFETAKDNESLLGTVISDSISAIIASRNATVAEQDKVACADSIAISIKNGAVRCKEAGFYLLRYVEHYSQYGNRPLKILLCECALNILRRYYPQQRYCALVERCYQRYASMLHAQNHKDEAKEIAEKRVILALNNRDYYTVAWWYTLLTGFYTMETWKGYVYYCKTVKFARIIERDQKRKHPHYMTDAVLIDQLGYDYMAANKTNFVLNLMLSLAADLENSDVAMLFYLKGSKYSLKKAMQIRSFIVKDKELRNTANSIEIKLDEARLTFLNYDYSKTLAILQTIKELYDSELSTETYNHYRLHSFIANVAMLLKDYNLAKEEFELCSVISKKLNRENDYAVRISLGRACNESYDIAMSEKINSQLLDEVSSLDAEIKNDYLPDVVYNMACLMVLKGEFKDAIHQFFRAIKLYGKTTKNADWKNLGTARCYHRLADLCLQDQKLLKSMHNKDGTETSVSGLYETAKIYYELSLSKQHPEYLSCIEQFKSLK